MKKIYNLIVIAIILIIANPLLATEIHPSDKLRIVTTIRPLHSLISSITGDLAEVNYLVDKNDSLHEFNLRPYDIEVINKANIIIIIDKSFENFMGKILDNLDSRQKLLEISSIPQLKLLHQRDNTIWKQEEMGNHSHHDHHHDHHHGNYDYHLWLNPDNMIVAVDNILKFLIATDPSNANGYSFNARQVKQRLIDLNLAIEKKLVSRAIPFMVFHDGYQYFEKKYKLNIVGSIILNQSIAAGAKSLSQLKNIIAENNVKCIFSEPQFSPKIIQFLKKETGIKTGVLDAEWGIDSSDATHAYFDMMLELANNIEACLAN